MERDNVPCIYLCYYTMRARDTTVWCPTTLHYECPLIVVGIAMLVSSNIYKQHAQTVDLLHFNDNLHGTDWLQSLLPIAAVSIYALIALPAWLPFYFCLAFSVSVVIGYWNLFNRTQVKRTHRPGCRFASTSVSGGELFTTCNLVKRWRRRNLRACQRTHEEKRRTVLHECFLSNNSDGRFKLPRPFSSADVDVDAFLDTQSPLDLMISINDMKVQDHVANVKKLMGMTCLQGPIRLARSDGCICNENEPDNYSTLLIYDTGYWRIIFWPCGLSTALTALTLKKLPFLWKIYPKTNTVLGIGTVMYKLKAANWDELLVPGLSYYLPECDVRLMSPQSTTNCMVDVVLWMEIRLIGDWTSKSTWICTSYWDSNG